MPFIRNYPNTYMFERNNAKEIHDVIVQKESEGWEVVKPARRVERGNFENVDTRTKWIVVMKFVKKTS
jgi:hypothetical protein